jgi:hypothetical protein
MESECYPGIYRLLLVLFIVSLPLLVSAFWGLSQVGIEADEIHLHQDRSFFLHPLRMSL